MAASVERLHPDVRFVSEIGGEDMKTIFFNGNEKTKSKQVLMQSACSGGTGTFVEKTARKLQIPTEQLSEMHYLGHTLHKISSKCGIFAEADANTLLKAGVTWICACAVALHYRVAVDRRRRDLARAGGVDGAWAARSSSDRSAGKDPMQLAQSRWRCRTCSTR